MADAHRYSSDGMSVSPDTGHRYSSLGMTVQVIPLQRILTGSLGRRFETKSLERRFTAGSLGRRFETKSLK